MVMAWVAMLVASTGGPAPTEPTSDRPGESQVALEGLWPTDRMIELLVQRTAREAAERYELTDEQHRRIEAGMVKRWQVFLRENRRELQPLINEYFESRLSLEPPSREQLQDWASRVLPVAEKVRRRIESGNQEIRRLLTPLQKVKFDSESLGIRAGIEAWYGQLNRWRRGEFIQSEAGDYPWDVPIGRGQASATGAARPTDPIEIELDKWDRHVADFIAAHHLDEGQRRSATSVLREVKERARAHRDRHRVEIGDLERAIRDGRKEDEGAVQASLESLYGPIDALYAELQSRLERIPRQEQRRADSQPKP